MKYRVQFHGRVSGAIGIFYPMTRPVEVDPAVAREGTARGYEGGRDLRWAIIRELGAMGFEVNHLDDYRPMAETPIPAEDGPRE